MLFTLGSAGDGYGLALVGLGLGLGVLVLGAAYGIGKLAAAAMDGIARQPEAAGDIRGTAIVLGALIEGFTFFALIVAILLNPSATFSDIAKQEAEAAKAAATATAAHKDHASIESKIEAADAVAQR